MSDNPSPNEKYNQLLQQGHLIGQILDLDKELSQSVNIEEVYNVPLRIRGIETRHGQQGDYIVMEATNLLNKEEMKLSTGGVVIKSIMTKIHNANAFPVDCAFYSPEGKNVKLIRDITPEDFE